MALLTHRRVVILGALTLMAIASMVSNHRVTASSQGTEIFLSTSISSPSVETSMTLFTGASPVKLSVWAANVKDPLGVGAFGIRVVYDPTLISVIILNPDVTWLELDGRSSDCIPPFWATTSPFVRAIPGDPDGLWEGVLSCITLDGPPPPPGVLGTGLLATLTVQPGSTGGSGSLDLSVGTSLVNTGQAVPVIPPAVIPATIHSMTVTILDLLPAADDDGDGCTNETEIGPEAVLGGQRDPLNPWDFYDVGNPSGYAHTTGAKDQVIDLFNDIVLTIQAFGTSNISADRGPSAGPHPWNMTAPDGVVDLFNDIVGVIVQFGHDCR